MHEHKANLIATQTALANYSDAIEPRLAKLAKLVEFSGNRVTVTAQNIQQAAAHVMNEVDTILGAQGV